MNRQSRRLEKRELAAMLARSKMMVAVVLDAGTCRFETISNVIEGNTDRPEELMARDLLNRMITSKNIMNAELDRFEGCRKRATERARMTSRDFEEVLKEELEESDAKVSAAVDDGLSRAEALRKNDPPEIEGRRGVKI